MDNSERPAANEPDSPSGEPHTKDGNYEAQPCPQGSGSYSDFQAIPLPMRQSRRWLLQIAKKPYYIDGTPRRGELDGVDDQLRLGIFEDAISELKFGNFDGLGFALGPDGTGNYWQGIDLDNVEANGLVELANSLPGYVEYSPSGNGVHAIGYGAWFSALGSNGTGIEAYCERRFFTVTGNVLRGAE